MKEKGNLISSGARIAGRHKRYVVWFFVLNLTLAAFGSSGFRAHAHAILDNNVYADKLLHGFDPVVLIEMLSRPEMGSPNSSTMPAFYCVFLFFLTTLLFIPGVLRGYASDERLPRDKFFSTCGGNLWRFVRLVLFFLLIAVPTFGILSGIQGALAKLAGESSSEKLPFYTRCAGFVIIFLIMTTIRVWFDLAQVDVVLRDVGRVRKSIAIGLRNTRSNLGQLLGSYVLISTVAVIVLAVGIWVWHVGVPSSSVLGAFVIGQLILLLWLAARFWQRAVAVAFYRQKMTEPDMEAQPVPMPAIGMPSVPEGG